MILLFILCLSLMLSREIKEGVRLWENRKKLKEIDQLLNRYKALLEQGFDNPYLMQRAEQLLEEVAHDQRTSH